MDLCTGLKQRNTQAEKQAIKEGRVPENWQDQPAKLRQKDRDARWTVKTTKAKPREGDTPLVDLAIPAFGYQNHISAKSPPPADPPLTSIRWRRSASFFLDR